MKFYNGWTPRTTYRVVTFLWTVAVIMLFNTFIDWVDSL